MPLGNYERPMDSLMALSGKDCFVGLRLSRNDGNAKLIYYQHD
jgi:hypothetical protein